jgi:hypothetical protein
MNLTEESKRLAWPRAACAKKRYKCLAPKRKNQNNDKAREVIGA